VIFLFSPSGNGAEAASLFQAGAERLGWIVIASNDARNGPTAPIRAAQEALWKEAFERTKADPKRVYAAGFSGGARMAMSLAEDHRSAFLGLISIGAFGTGRTLGPGRLAHVMICGEEDFNQAELAAAWERMRGSSDRRLWMEHFPGGHRWPPADLIEEAMTFLDLAAGVQGRQPRNLEGEAAFLQRRLKAAQSASLGIDRAQAGRRWRDVAALPGAPAEAEQQARALAKDPDFQTARALERSFAERARNLRSDSAYGAELHRLLGVAAGKGPEALDARRLLDHEKGALEERCQEALEGRAWELGLKLARGLIAIGDRRSRGGVYAAMALAMLGRKEEALAELKGAFERGYQPGRPLADMPLLAPLREEPAFKALQAKSP
jgi:predicted esterase